MSGKTSGGPYWPKASWDSYCSRVVIALVNNCGYSKAEAENAVKNNSQGVIVWE